MKNCRIACLGALFLVCVAGWAATIHVVEPGTEGVVPGAPYHTWTNAATNIATAVKYASDAGGDTVLVSNGTYRLQGVISIGKPVIVKSLGGAAATVVNAQYPAYTSRVFEISHPTAEVDGFTVTGGRNSDDGGGVYITASGGTIRNCTIISNSAKHGGGLVLFGSTGKALVDQCLVVSNTAENGGGFRTRGTNCYIVASTVLANTATTSMGGIYDDTAAGVVVSNCLIVSNDSQGGSCGGLINCLVYDSRIIGNTSFTYGGGGAPKYVERCVVSGNVSQTSGGGLYLSSAKTVVNSVVADNISGLGGGIYIGGGGTVIGSVLRNNTATTNGGGVYGNTSGTIRNCLVCNNTAANYGGGMYLDRIGNYYTGVVESCTVAGNSANSGGGLFLDKTNNWVTNSIVYANTAATASSNIYAVTTQTNAFGYCCAGFANFAPDRMNLTSDPLFANPAAGDFRLAAGSRCINAGTNQTWMPGALDLDGRRRLDWVGGAVDLGCYEVVPPGTMIRLR